MRTRVVVAAAIAVVLGIAAATASASSSRHQASGITVWLQVDAQSGWPDIVAAATQQFQKDHPGVNVNVQYQSWTDHLQKFVIGDRERYFEFLAHIPTLKRRKFTAWLKKALKDGHEVYLVSHKSEASHLDPSVRLREAINQEVSQTRTHVILNLEEVDYIDSTGLGCMVICYTTLQKAGGTLKLLKLNRRNIELLLLTKLSTIFEIPLAGEEFCFVAA